MFRLKVLQKLLFSSVLDSFGVSSCFWHPVTTNKARMIPRQSYFSFHPSIILSDERGTARHIPNRTPFYITYFILNSVIKNYAFFSAIAACQASDRHGMVSRILIKTKFVAEFNRAWISTVLSTDSYVQVWIMQLPCVTYRHLSDPVLQMDPQRS